MSTLRRLAHKDATVSGNASRCLPDLSEYRGMQGRYTRQNTAMTEILACSTFYYLAETSQLTAAGNNGGPPPVCGSGCGLKVVFRTDATMKSKNVLVPLIFAFSPTAHGKTLRVPTLPLFQSGLSA